MDESNVQAAFDAGKRLSEAQGTVRYPNGTNGIPFLLVDGEVKTLDHLLTAPVRRKASVVFKDLESFIAYLNEFKRANTKIFADFNETGGSFTAALDFHGVDAPSFVEDKASYPCPTTPEWNAWIGRNGKPIAQVDFAHFVEEQRIAFKNPSGATMLEIARTLEGKVGGEFKSGVNLDNGDRELVFSENTTASAGRGEKIPIPSKITLYLQPFFHGAYYQIETLLRYRIKEGEVVFVYEMQKVHEVIDAALQQIRNEITEKTQITPYIGKF